MTAMTEHQVRAHNLKFGDRILIDSEFHIVTILEPFTRFSMVVHAELADVKTQIVTETKMFAQTFVTVYIPA